MTLLEEIRNDLSVFQYDWMNDDIRHDLRKARATAVGWKVADLEGFMAGVIELLPLSRQHHVADVEGRKIGCFVLYEALPLDIMVVKLMQRRPDNHDPLGLDHIDFSVWDTATNRLSLEAVGVEVHAGSNPNHSWISVASRHGTELKIVERSVLGICATELLAAEKEILADLHLS